MLLLGDTPPPTQKRRTGHALASTTFPRNVPRRIVKASGILTLLRQAYLKTLGDVERRWVRVFIVRRGWGNVEWVYVFFVSLDEGVFQVFHDAFQCNVFVVIFWAEDRLSDFGKLRCGWCGWYA